jgi:hypothetical protein
MLHLSSDLGFSRQRSELLSHWRPAVRAVSLTLKDGFVLGYLGVAAYTSVLVWVLLDTLHTTST